MDRQARPTAEQLRAAADKTLPDVIAPDLAVLFVGINPGLWSAATGHHFARPGNRFWPALHGSGCTPRQLAPAEQDELLRYGFGITNLVARASAKAEELSAAELRAGATLLTERAATYRPKIVAMVGITAYRTAFARRAAVIGPQTESIADSRLWVLPNPSGLNAHWQLPELTGAFAEVRVAAHRLDS